MNPRVELQLPREAYDSIEAWNASLLKIVCKQTPAHAYQAYFAGNERPDSAAFRIGTMVHEWVLEPEVFLKYATTSHGTRTKLYKEAMADAAAKGKPLAAEDEYQLAKAMGDAIKMHPIVGGRFSSEHLNFNEVTLTWTTDGKPCKARLDAIRYVNGKLWIADLKTCQNASWDAFGRDSLEYLYVLQASFYADGAYACRRDLEKCWGLPAGELENIPMEFEFICIEKTAPHFIARYSMTDEQAMIGRSLYESALAKAQAAKDLEYWPSYDINSKPLALPPWADRVVEKLLES